MPRYIFQQSKLPSFKSTWGRKLAKDLWQFKLYCHDARRSREQYVRECDESYLCKRIVPDTGAAELIEDGEFGESDIHDNANIVSIRLALSLMPRNDPWLTVTSCTEQEPPGTVEGIQDWQMFLHRKARTRRNMQRTIKQGYVRGSTYLHYDWDTVYRLRKMTTAQHAVEIRKFLEEQGLPPSAAKKYSLGRVQEVLYNGPVIAPVDFFDVWVEPFTDIVNARRPTTILQRFRHKAQLMSEVDEFDQPVYKNLEDVEPFELSEIYHNRDLAGWRPASQRIFGAPTTAIKSGIKLVPVYIFYLSYYKTDDGIELHDTYVHVALSSKGFTPHIIKIEENPTGLNHLLMDHYVDWFVPTPYGLSGVEFQVHKLNVKNFMQLLTMTGAAHSIMGPKLIYEPAFRDPDEIDFGAGGAIAVQENPLGLEVIRDVPGYQSGVLLGNQELRFLAEEMRAAAGVDGLAPDNGARSLTKPKTATEINRDVTSGSFFLDNQAENLNDMLTELCQGVYELSIQNMMPSEENEAVIEFEKYLGDRVVNSMLEIKDLQVRRGIQVRGINGQLNKQQATQNLLQMFQIASQIQDPRAVQINMFIAQKLSRKLDVNLPPELMMSPEEVVASNPQVQLAAIQQGLQNPEVVQALAQQMGAMMPAGPAEGQGPPNDQQGAIEPGQRIDSGARGAA